MGTQGYPGTESDDGYVIASDRAWGRTGMGEAAGGPAIVLALFSESEFIPIPTAQGADTINKLCTPEEVCSGTGAGSTSRWEVSVTPNLEFQERRERGRPEMGSQRQPAPSQCVWGVNLLVLPLLVFSCSPQYSNSSQQLDSTGVRALFKGKSKDLIKSKNPENRMNRNETLSAAPQEAPAE